MSNRHDTSQILRCLAETLDVDKTLRMFPGMTREDLAAIVRSAAGPERSEGAREAVLSVDGAARGNPGPAGAGFVLEQADGTSYSFGVYLGEATNNVAEYKALIEGLNKALDLGIRELCVRSDSELMVNQLNGHYKVKNPQLQELYFSVIRAASSIGKVTFTHVPRGENKEADRLANLAIDAKGPVEL